jgi:hypothetical protein
MLGNSKEDVGCAWKGEMQVGGDGSCVGMAVEDVKMGTPSPEYPPPELCRLKP